MVIRLFMPSNASSTTQNNEVLKVWWNLHEEMPSAGLHLYVWTPDNHAIQSVHLENNEIEF